MKELIDTTLLEFEKSGYLIDLVKHQSGQLYVEVEQHIYDELEGKRVIKINASVLPDLINVLQKYRALLPQAKDTNTLYITERQQVDIQRNYLKGIPIESLSLQTGIKVDLIEMILRNKGIYLVSEKEGKPRYWRRRKKN